MFTQGGGNLEGSGSDGVRVRDHYGKKSMEKEKEASRFNLKKLIIIDERKEGAGFFQATKGEEDEESISNNKTGEIDTSS